jgi:hypothetical protein
MRTKQNAGENERNVVAPSCVSDRQVSAETTPPCPDGAQKKRRLWTAHRGPERRLLSGAINRCHNESDKGYSKYGARGIRVWYPWRCGERGFRKFLAHVGPRPGSGYTLGRIDNDRGYEPGNVRWETWTQQQNNRRSNVWLTVGDKTLTLVQWSRETGIDRQLITTRRNRGWAMEVAVTTPKGVNKNDAHERAGIPPARATNKRMPLKRNRPSA